MERSRRISIVTGRRLLLFAILATLKPILILVQPIFHEVLFNFLTCAWAIVAVFSQRTKK